MNERKRTINALRRLGRKEWIRHNGALEKDSDGRSYEVHHIDGDYTNNHISNLISLSIHEHYEIHYWQGDWAACHAIAQRGIVSVEERSRLGKLAAKRGNNHYRFDHNIYNFKHRDTQEEFTGTRAEFIKTYSLEFTNVALLVKHKVKTVKGWMLLENFEKNIYRPYAYAPTKEYQFKNTNTNEIVTGTRKYMAEHHDLSTSKTLELIKGTRRQHKGWIFVDQDLVESGIN